MSDERLAMAIAMAMARLFDFFEMAGGDGELETTKSAEGDDELVATVRQAYHIAGETIKLTAIDTYFLAHREWNLLEWNVVSEIKSPAEGNNLVVGDGHQRMSAEACHPCAIGLETLDERCVHQLEACLLSAMDEHSGRKQYAFNLLCAP